jgi:branched-chain amino acid transport system substrate-binding protein
MIIIRHAQEIGIDAIPVGGDGWSSIDFSESDDWKLKQGYFSTHWSRDIDKKVVRDFLNTYELYTDIEVPTVLAYDAVFLLVDAVGRAGSLEREKIRQALADISNFKGVTGTITFDDNGDPIKSIVIFKIINGRKSYLKTIEPERHNKVKAIKP